MRRFLTLFLLIAAVALFSPNLMAQEEPADVEEEQEAVEDVAEETEFEGEERGLFFVGAYVGKERRVLFENEALGVALADCVTLLGVKAGLVPQLGDNFDAELSVGGKFVIADDDDIEDNFPGLDEDFDDLGHSFFVDAALHALFEHGFFGAGVSFWDLNKEHLRTVALLLQLGLGTRTFQFSAEARAPFEHMDDLGNNYMFWAGVRIRPGGREAEAVIPPPPPAPPAGPPPAPTPAPTPAGPPEFVWPEVYFPFDQYVLTAETRQKLDEVASHMTDNPGVNVTIEGHCCYIGTDEYNLALGQHRADAIKDYLVAKGISADRLRTVSYGETRPKYDNEKEITRRFNRRGFFVTIRPE